MSLRSGFGGRDECKLWGYRECGMKDVIDIGKEASLQDRCALRGVWEMDKMFLCRMVAKLVFAHSSRHYKRGLA
jgi:hypothetical protein